MSSLPQGVHLTLPAPKGAEKILSTEALEFLAVLHRTFNARRLELLENRRKVQQELDSVSLTFRLKGAELGSRVAVRSADRQIALATS